MGLSKHINGVLGTLTGYTLQKKVRQSDVKLTKTLTDVFKNLRTFQLTATDREWKQLLFYYEMMGKIQGIPGDIIECGVSGGISFISFARLNNIFERGLDHKEYRKLYGFDSFEGLPRLTQEDKSDLVTNLEMKEGGFYDPLAYDDLIRFSEKENNVFLIKGWFDQSIPNFKEKHPHIGIALLHIDCDLYESTKVVLTELWDHIVPGGVVVFDELYHKDFPGETKAFMEVLNGKGFDLKKSSIKPDKKYVIKY
ncbi:MAG: TylF/MycF/NovP-related O-methyltransferase [Cyclobacteriaceae bacterium]